jgi:hypothetical protein
MSENITEKVITPEDLEEAEKGAFAGGVASTIMALLVATPIVNAFVNASRESWELNDLTTHKFLDGIEIRIDGPNKAEVTTANGKEILFDFNGHTIRYEVPSGDPIFPTLTETVFLPTSSSAFNEQAFLGKACEAARSARSKLLERGTKGSMPGSFDAALKEQQSFIGAHCVAV